MNQKKKSRGRPKAPIDEEQLSKLAEIYVSLTEAAYVLGVSRKTLWQRMKEEEELRSAWQAGRARTRAAIRRKQIQEALSGNTAMLIWLGKNLLGQTDKQEQRIEQSIIDKSRPIATALPPGYSLDLPDDDDDEKET